MNTQEQFKCPICGKKITITPNLYFAKKLICMSCHQTYKNPVYERYRGRLDEAMKDPDEPKNMKAEFNCGDGLHPSAKGYVQMAEAINLSLFNLTD